MIFDNTGGKDPLRPWLNWRFDKKFENYKCFDSEINNYRVMAKNYEESALAMIDLVIRENNLNFSEDLIFPILLMVNHSIELYIKLILKLNNYDESKLGHDLKVLWDVVKTYGDKINVEVSIEAFLINLEKYIKEVEDKNLNQLLRYPYDKKGNSFYLESIEPISVNLSKLRIFYKDVTEKLYCLYCTLENNIINNN